MRSARCHRCTPPDDWNDHHGQVSWLPDRHAALPSRINVQWHIKTALPGYSCGGSAGVEQHPQRTVRTGLPS